MNLASSVVSLLMCCAIPLMSVFEEGARLGRPSPQQDRGSLVTQALLAKHQGKTSLALTVRLDRAIDVGFDSVKSEVSFFVATGTHKPAVAIAGPDFVHTWHTLRLEKTLAAPPVSQWFCGGEVPTGLKLDPGEVMIPLMGGTATVEGVAVTVTGLGRQPSFEAGRRYLLVGALCPGRRLILSFEDSSVLPVTSDGRIVSPDTPNPFTFVRQIVGFGNLEELSRRLLAQQ
jgi:hypothetical protein